MKNSGSALSAVKKNYANYVIKKLEESRVVCRRTSFTIRIRPLAELYSAVALLARVRRIRAKAPSFKHQASSPKLLKHQATSVKPQAASVKLKPASVKLHDA